MAVSGTCATLCGTERSAAGHHHQQLPAVRTDARARGGWSAWSERPCMHACTRARPRASPAQSQHMTRPRRGATPTELGPPRARARADARATRASAARRTDRARPRGARALTAEGRQRGRARLARSRPRSHEKSVKKERGEVAPSGTQRMLEEERCKRGSGDTVE